ncbi:MAG: hypothetical protein E7378_02400 [Clostridiales bacterium]|nr:hypothetical protein [Clostridiales bacterium]
MQKILQKLKNLFKYPIILIFVLICIFFLPTAINTSSISFRAAVIVAMGIDKNDQDQIELYSVVNVSSTTESLSENSKVVTSSGATIGEALSNLSLIFGRTIKLWHARFIMIGPQISQDNLGQMLDVVVRTNKIRNTVQLIYCDSSVKDLFNVGIQLKSQTGVRLSDIICYEHEYSTTSINSNVDSFYKGYLSKGRVSKLNLVSLSGDITQGINPASDIDSGLESSSSQSSGTDGGKGGESSEGGVTGSKSKAEKSYISNVGDLAIFKDGKFVAKASGQVAEGINWFYNQYVPKKLFVEVSTPKLKNAKVNFDVLYKSVTKEMFFHKGIPFYESKIYLHVDVAEVVVEDKQKVGISYSLVEDEIKSAVARRIREEISSALNFCKTYNVDALSINNQMYESKQKQYMQYIENGNTEDDLIQNTQVSAEVEIKIV